MAFRPIVFGEVGGKGILVQVALGIIGFEVHRVWAFKVLWFTGFRAYCRGLFKEHTEAVFSHRGFQKLVVHFGGVATRRVISILKFMLGSPHIWKLIGPSDRAGGFLQCNYIL